MIRPVRSLMLVNERDGDVELARESLARRGLIGQLQVARDGAEALRLLRADGPSERVHAVLVDGDLSGMPAEAVVSEIRGDERLRDLPVFVLHAPQPGDDAEALRLAGADGCIGKPVNADELQLLLALCDWRAVRRQPVSQTTS